MILTKYKEYTLILQHKSYNPETGLFGWRNVAYFNGDDKTLQYFAFLSENNIKPFDPSYRVIEKEFTF